MFLLSSCLFQLSKLSMLQREFLQQKKENNKQTEQNKTKKKKKHIKTSTCIMKIKMQQHAPAPIVNRFYQKKSFCYALGADEKTHRDVWEWDSERS